MTDQRKWHWHWSNESRGRIPWSGRAWLYVRDWRFHWEWVLLTFTFGIGIEFERYGDDAVLMTFKVPGFGIYFGFTPPFKSRFTQWLPEESRECRLSIHDWAVWINPWSKSMSWSRSDPCRDTGDRPYRSQPA